MKSIKESILSSTKTGIYKKVEAICTYMFGEQSRGWEILSDGSVKISNKGGKFELYSNIDFERAFNDGKYDFTDDNNVSKYSYRKRDKKKLPDYFKISEVDCNSFYIDSRYNTEVTCLPDEMNGILRVINFESDQFTYIKMPTKLNGILDVVDDPNFIDLSNITCVGFNCYDINRTFPKRVKNIKFMKKATTQLVQKVIDEKNVIDVKGAYLSEKDITL